MVNAVLVGVLVLAGISVMLQSNLVRGWLVASASGVHHDRLPRAGDRPPDHPRVPPPGVMTLAPRGAWSAHNAEAEEIATSSAATRNWATRSSASWSERDRWTDESVIDLRTGQDLGPYLGRPTEVLDLVRATGATGVVVATTDTNAGHRQPAHPGPHP